MQKKTKSVKKSKSIEIIPAEPITNLPDIRRDNQEVDTQYLIQTAIQSSAQMDVIERLFDLRNRQAKEKSEKAFREAMAAFQSECPIIKKMKGVKNRDNSERYKYAPLDTIIAQVGKLIAKHGFSYNFKSIQTENSFTAVCLINHIGGHTEESTFTVPVSFQTITGVQATGAARSYANRYAFCNGFGILTMDDETDGNSKKHNDDDQRKAAAIEKLKTLPENIIKGFEILGYGIKAQWQFCEDRKWIYQNILADINKIVDKNA